MGSILERTKLDKDDDLWLYCRTLILMAKCRIAKKDYQDALKYLKEADNVSEQPASPRIVAEIHANTLLDLVKCYRKMDDMFLLAAYNIGMVGEKLSEASMNADEKSGGGLYEAYADWYMHRILCGAELDKIVFCPQLEPE